MSYYCLIFVVAEIMGHRPWANETASDEFVHHVDGRQFDFHFSDHDGWNDVHPAYSGSSLNSAELV